MTSAIIVHTYIGSLLYGCKENNVDVLSCQETEQFGKFTQKSVAIQKTNFPNERIVGNRTEWFKPSDIPADNNWFVIGFPPCSAGSMATNANNRGGLENPKSAFKFTFELLQYAYSLKAPIIAIESVPGTYRALMGDIKRIRDQHGPEYGIAMILENSSAHGCASTRRRFWQIQFRKDLFPNGITWDRGEPQLLSVSEALANPESDYGVSPNQMKDYNRFKNIIDTMPVGSYVNGWLRKNNLWDMVPEQYRHLIKTKKCNNDRYIYYESVAAYKLHPDKPAPTVTGSTIIFHPWEPRPLTIREYLRICGFPEDFKFPAGFNPNDCVTYIGKQATIGMCSWIVRNIKANLEAL